MNKEVKTLLFKVKRLVSEVGLVIEEIRLTIIKEELGERKDERSRKAVYDDWYRHYLALGHIEKDAREYARKKYIEAIEAELVHNPPFPPLE